MPADKKWKIVPDVCFQSFHLVGQDIFHFLMARQINIFYRAHLDTNLVSRKRPFLLLLFTVGRFLKDKVVSRELG